MAGPRRGSAVEGAGATVRVVAAASVVLVGATVLLSSSRCTPFFGSTSPLAAGGLQGGGEPEGMRVEIATASAVGPRFDGIGAISGGGATSRLLVDYPSDVRDDILDLLFLPNHGAALQMIKVEIGGDAQSTDGSETSHMHSPDDLDLNRGYEWFILKEAKKRNPDILTYGLPWAFPGWLRPSGSGSPFADPMRAANYTVQWVLGAKTHHDIDIDFLGIWNERGGSKAYTLTLRKVLDQAGLHRTKIVVNDGADAICLVLSEDPEYRAAVDVVGLHYPSDQRDIIRQTCNKLGLPVWAAEESSSYDDNNGAACWGRVITSHFVLQGMTSSLMWNLVGSYMHGTLWYASSMLTAVQPWSGYFEAEAMPVVWATAHYTHFTEPGWHYLDVGHGSGELAKGGYFVTLVSPDGEDMTLIVVKISREHAPCTRPGLWQYSTAPERVKFLLPELQKMPRKLYARHSNFEDDPGKLFEEVAVELDPEDGSFTLDIAVGDMFTVSTVGTAKKGSARTQAGKTSDSSFPLPYKDTFASYKCNGCYAKFLTDQMGAFEVHDGVLRQMAPMRPVQWAASPFGANTVIGMTEWEDLSVSVTVKLPEGGDMNKAAGCVGARADQNWKFGVSLCISRSRWDVMYGAPQIDSTSSQGAITGGRVAIQPGTWHVLQLDVQESRLSAFLDGEPLVQNRTIRKRDNGFAMLGVNGYYPIEFKDLKVDKIGPRWALPSGVAEIDWTNFALARASDLVLRPCTPNGLLDSRQQFVLKANYQILHVASGLCVDASDPAHLVLAACAHKNPAQTFHHDYTLVRNTVKGISNQHGRLAGVANGVKLQLISDKDAETMTESDADMVTAWILFPNSMQLRSQLTFRGAGVAQCVTVLPPADAWAAAL